MSGVRCRCGEKVSGKLDGEELHNGLSVISKSEWVSLDLFLSFAFWKSRVLRNSQKWN